MLIDSSPKVTDFGGLGVPVEGDPHFGADLNTLPRTQSGLFYCTRSRVFDAVLLFQRYGVLSIFVYCLFLGAQPCMGVLQLISADGQSSLAVKLGSLTGSPKELSYIQPQPFEEGREINLTASLRSGPEYSFTPHPKVECKKKAVDLPGPGEYYRPDEPERSKTSFSIGPSINDMGGCPVELLHCSHCEKKTLETWTPAERGKRPRPKECSTKGCVSQDFA